MLWGCFLALVLSLHKLYVTDYYLMQYVRGTVSKGIQFSGSIFEMHIITDAEWSRDILNRRSTTGYVVQW